MNSPLPWNPDVQEIPFEVPVLVRLRSPDSPPPFMAIRCADFEPDAVSYLLGPDMSAYGVYVDLSQLSSFMLVMD